MGNTQQGEKRYDNSQMIGQRSDVARSRGGGSSSIDYYVIRCTICGTMNNVPKNVQINSQSTEPCHMCERNTANVRLPTCGHYNLCLNCIMHCNAPSQQNSANTNNIVAAPTKPQHRTQVQPQSQPRVMQKSNSQLGARRNPQMMRTSNPQVARTQNPPMKRVSNPILQTRRSSATTMSRPAPTVQMRRSSATMSMSRQTSRTFAPPVSKRTSATTTRNIQNPIRKQSVPMQIRKKKN